MMKKNIKKGMSGGKKMAIAGGVAALGAGAYYLLGPNAKKHQKKASGLMAKMEKEIKSEIKEAKKIKNEWKDAAQKAVKKPTKVSKKRA